MNLPLKSRYPSDLTDSQWSRLEPLLPPERLVGRHRTIALRDIANAINYRWETGCVWRMLPHDFPAWGTVYAYFRNWQRAGVIRQLREILLEPRQKLSPRSAHTGTTAAIPARTQPSRIDPAAPGRNLGDPRDTEFTNDGFSQPTGRTMPRPSADPSSITRLE